MPVEVPPELWERGRELSVRLGTACAIFFAFWIASRVFQSVVRRVSSRAPLNADLVQLLGRTVKVGIQIFGAVTALGTAGLNVSALVAGLGLTGFALGFALRDILSNVLAGVLLLFYRPFGRGDHILVTGLEGVVSDIDLRYTVLEHEGRTVLIPNSNLFTNPIVVLRRGGA